MATHDLPDEREAHSVVWPSTMGATVGESGVTRIVITRDLPGLHCDMERIRVYAGDRLVREGPVALVECIRYDTPEPVNF